jgi:hypothetical protein
MGISKATAIIAGLSYMSSGFILGHLQHFVWITGTAFFPYILLYFIRIHKNPILKNFILGGACTMLFLSSTHPGLVIGALYFFLFLFVGIHLLRKEQAYPFYNKRFWPVNLLFLAITVSFSIVILTSNIDVLQHISRGNKISLNDALLTPTPLSSYLSLLFPLAVQSPSFSDSDIAMRNTWIGVYLFIGLLLFLRYSNKKLAVYTVFVLLFFMLLSAGGWFKTMAYYVLPFIGYVRLNGEFSYFVLLPMILAGAAGLDRHSPTPLLRPLKWICMITTLLSVLFLLFRRPIPIPTGDWKQMIKGLIDHLGFWHLLLLQSILLLLTLIFLLKAGPSKTKTTLVIAANLIFTCWVILPYTGLGMASKTDRQRLISTFPKGIHAQEQVALKKTVFLDSIYSKDLILLGSYTKKIGYPGQEAYPVELSTVENFFGDSVLVDFILRQSWLFLSSDTTVRSSTRFDSSAIRVKTFGPGHLKVSVSDSSYHYLTFLQNDYPYWKIRLDGRPVKHLRGFRTFITVPLPPAPNHEVEYIFDPRPIKIALLINGLLLALAVCLLSIKRARSWSPFTRD